MAKECRGICSPNKNELELMCVCAMMCFFVTFQKPSVHVAFARARFYLTNLLIWAYNRLPQKIRENTFFLHNSLHLGEKQMG